MDGNLVPPKVAQFTMTRSIRTYSECDLTLLSKEKINFICISFTCSLTVDFYVLHVMQDEKNG